MRFLGGLVALELGREKNPGDFCIAAPKNFSKPENCGVFDGKTCQL